MQKPDQSNERLNVERERFTDQVMISLKISKIVKTSIHFITPGVMVNSDTYCKQLLANMLPEIEICPKGDYILMQDVTH